MATEVELDISGMTCASCANRIERKLNKLDGVTASVNYATEKARVEYVEPVTTDDLLATVSAAGYAAALPDVELGFRSRAIDALITRAIVDGCRRPLADGLRFESEMFGACCATEDMRIGVRTFQEKGPRAQPVFVHR